MVAVRGALVALAQAAVVVAAVGAMAAGHPASERPRPERGAVAAATVVVSQAFLAALVPGPLPAEAR